MPQCKKLPIADQHRELLVSGQFIQLVYVRRRAFLPLQELPNRGDDEPVPPPHRRSTRWQSDEAFEMRRITPLVSKAGDLTGYRPMIQRGHGENGKRYHASFRASEFGGSLEEALRHAKLWRDNTESKLGIKPGSIRSKSVLLPWSGISLIVSKSTDGRAYWGSNRVASKPTIRVYIGQKSYVEAYHCLITKIAERDGLELPAELPLPPPPKRDQYRRMVKVGLKNIPEPASRQRRS